MGFFIRTLSKKIHQIKCDNGNKFDTVDKEVVNIKMTTEKEISNLKADFQQKMQMMQNVQTHRLKRG